MFVCYSIGIATMNEQNPRKSVRKISNFIKSEFGIPVIKLDQVKWDSSSYVLKSCVFFSKIMDIMAAYRTKRRK